MKSLYIAILLCVTLLLFIHNNIHAQDTTVTTLPNEVRLAFEYLNRIRNNPASFSDEIGIDLSDVKKMPPLIWNTLLAKSAQKKAEDMATRDYLGHYTPEGVGPGIFVLAEGYYLPLEWPDASQKNYIESISGGSSMSGIEHIKNLIFDNGVPHSSSKANHRKHLLGMTKFWASHVDIGIGFAYNPKTKYKGYFVIHTARPGEPYVTISGTLFAPHKKILNSDIKDIWVGIITKDGKKYWTKTSLCNGRNSTNYQLRIPMNITVILRYFKELPNKQYLRGYYSNQQTVYSQSEADWITVGANDILNLDLNLK